MSVTSLEPTTGPKYQPNTILKRNQDKITSIDITNVTLAWEDKRTEQTEYLGRWWTAAGKNVRDRLRNFPTL